MIGRIYRFHGRGSLNYVYKHGTVVRAGLLSLKYTPNSRRQTYRLAVVVSRKVSKSAVVRNRIRRRLYEIVRKNDLCGSAYDVVLLVYNEQLATMPAPEVEKLIIQLFTKAGLTKKDNAARGAESKNHAIVKEKE